MTNLVLVGPPGAGKGTQAARICEKLEIPQISTGEIFRAAISAGTELGQTAQSYISKGDLVPDEITDALVRERLSEPDAKAGFLLDGYPRNLHQVSALDKTLAGLDAKLDLVIELDIPDAEITERLLKRAEIENRADDTAEIIRHRILVYHCTTEPITAAYAERGLLLKVDGTGTIEEVTRRIVQNIRKTLAN
ncbi:MAG: adenylate kinase [Trueperella sp.]|nr:adenylate kinase [Trueperella sp.]